MRNGTAMRRWLHRCFFLALCLPGLAVAAAAGEAPVQRVVQRVVQGDWQEVREHVMDAITARGFVVAHVNRIGEMLDRTGRDIGDSRRIYAHAEALEFCSARLSRQMMEADPHNIVFCPYTIFVYALAGRPRTVYLAYRQPAGGQTAAARQALAAVDRMLAGILDEAAAAK